MSKPPKTASRSRYVTSTMSGERVQAFVPAPLPPAAKTLDLPSLQGILAEANQAVGRLDGMTSTFPDPNLFLYSYVRKEAVLSSQIEGTQSSLSDLLLYENAEVPAFPLMMCRRCRTTLPPSIMGSSAYAEVFRCRCV